MDDKSQESESQMSAAELSMALFEMRDCLVRLSLTLKDALFEAHVLNQTKNNEATSLHSVPDKNTPC